jgi:hypothetical protein
MVFDASAVVYSDSIKNKNNSGRTIPMNMPGGERISLQLSSSIHQPSCAMWAPSLPPNTTDPLLADKYVLDAIVSDEKVIDSLRDLDKRNVDYCVMNSPALFNQELTADAVRAIYAPLVKTRDGVDFVRLRIPLNKGEADKTSVIVVDSEEDGIIKWHPGNISDIARGSKFVAVTEAYGMYLIRPNNIGMTLTLTNIMVWPGSDGGAATAVSRFQLGDIRFSETKFD